MRKYRSRNETEGALACGAFLKHLRTQDVRRHQVGRELDALGVQPQRNAQRFDQLGLGEAGKLIAWGPGPRASQSLMLAVRARALLDGRLAPSIDDVLDLAEPVLKHRMALTFSARAEGRTVSDVVGQLKSRIG